MSSAKTRNGWGGKRPGSGRKPLYAGEKMSQVCVKLTTQQLETYKAVGGADWVRDQLDRLFLEAVSGKQKPIG